MTDCRHHVPGSIHALISFKIEVTYTFINICWVEVSRDFEISSKFSVEAIKNTTLSKRRPMRSDADLPIKSLVLIFFLTHLLFQVLLWSHDFDNLYGRNSQVNIYGCCMHIIYPLYVTSLPTCFPFHRCQRESQGINYVAFLGDKYGRRLRWFLLLLNWHFPNIYWHQIFTNHRSFFQKLERGGKI